MNLEQFTEAYKQYKYRDVVSVKCSQCETIETLNKDSAVRNIKTHNQFLCRSCSFTEEGKQRIAKALQYKRDAATKQKMSDAKKAYYQTDAGLQHKKHLSCLAAKGHADNKFNKSKRKGLYFSNKNKKQMAYNSSYELRLCVELESNPEVVSYETQIYYETNEHGRSLDFLVHLQDHTTKAIEVKPQDRLTEQPVIEQLRDSAANAAANGWQFEIYTEQHFHMTPQELRVWADDLRSKTGEINYTEHRKQLNRDKANRHYHDKIAQDIVDVYCDYCQETHSPLRLTYEKNIARNGRYICEKEGGHIAGSKPKPHLIKENPYAAEGKKQCNKCGEVKLFEEFSPDKSKRDGYSTRCKTCRAEVYRLKYRNENDN